MLRQNNFSKHLGVKTWLACSENGYFQVCSAIYINNNNVKMYTYYDNNNEIYVTVEA